jgi:hypothetical protein
MRQSRSDCKPKGLLQLLEHSGLVGTTPAFSTLCTLGFRMGGSILHKRQDVGKITAVLKF